MTYYDAEHNAKVTITCGGKPLDGPYVPPPSALAELGRFYASRYAANADPRQETTYTTSDRAQE